MIDAAVDPAVVARIVGHAASHITLDVYTGIRPDAMREATPRVERLIVVREVAGGTTA